jgi:hypothetical protein
VLRSPDLLPQVPTTIGRPSLSSHYRGNGSCCFRLVGHRPLSPLLLFALVLGRQPPDPAGMGSSGLGCTCLLAIGVGSSVGSLGLESGTSAMMAFCPTQSRSPPTADPPSSRRVVITTPDVGDAVPAPTTLGPALVARGLAPLGRVAAAPGHL